MKFHCPKCQKELDYQGGDQVICPNCETSLLVDDKVKAKYFSEMMAFSIDKEFESQVDNQKVQVKKKMVLSKVDTSDGDLHKWAVRVRKFVFFMIAICVVVGIVHSVFVLGTAQADGSVRSEIIAMLLVSFLKMGLSIPVVFFSGFLFAAILDRQAHVARNLQILAEKETIDQKEKNI